MISTTRQLALLGIVAMLFSCNEHTVRKEGYRVHGIDVSHYQKHIDWPTVAGQGIHFVFAKATEGATLQDSLFCRNWSEIQAVGLKRGAYHFFRPATDAVRQARNFLATVPPEDGDLAPVLDVEVVDGVDAETLREGMRTWLREVETVYMVKPIIYSNQKFFNNYLAGHFHDYPIWIARYSAWRKPCLKAGHVWDFWQYGNRGRLAGIDGDVDLNVFRGSVAALENHTIKRPAPLFAPAVVEDAFAANP